MTVDHCRFLYTKLLSLRPLLLSATRRKRRGHPNFSSFEESPSSLDEALIKHCCNMCLTIARDLVGTLHQHLDTAYKSSGWHSVYCRVPLVLLPRPILTLTLLPVTFAAATILLAGWKCQEVDLEVLENSFETCWTQCLSILDHYKEQIHSAPRAIQALQTLRHQVMAVENQG